MKLFLGCLVIFISTITAIDAIAPGDRSPICRTNFRYRLSHDWIPYANDTSSGTWKVLIDQYDYETLEGQFSIPPGVWSALDVDNDGLRVGILTSKIANCSVVRFCFAFSSSKEVVGHVPIKFGYQIHIGLQAKTTGSLHKPLITLMLWS